ncbi:hypothetical protein GCM10010136_25820 [Limoniibacter endophyticus]|uniref:Uncharacterized protein n=1 Tax=Limoniibacter endophyticus TaxID=1565040 RepID=A0A8J3GI34_9HYPH|nr:hypothetical protein GCM10010136_25820 [Limoniibacter endophyticus]
MGRAVRAENLHPKFPFHHQQAALETVTAPRESSPKAAMLKNLRSWSRTINQKLAVAKRHVVAAAYIHERIRRKITAVQNGEPRVTAEPTVRSPA